MRSPMETYIDPFPQKRGEGKRATINFCNFSIPCARSGVQISRRSGAESEEKMAEKPVVTNAMRLLKAAGIDFETREYEVDESDLSGVHAAEVLGLPPEQVFKTLVLRGEKQGILVCVLPVELEVDLKKLARAAGDKKVEMIHMKELLPLTGYIRGGCSPVGMKKEFPTYIDETAMLFDAIAVSGGMRGVQLIVNPDQLLGFVKGEYVDLTA